MKKKLKVLLVEDEFATRILNAKVLESMEVEVDMVENGVEALEHLKGKWYDFVLMDIGMPVQDGMDTVRWLREHDDDYYRAIPIFALTNFRTAEHTREILDAGMNEHLIKPLNEDELKRVIDKYC